MNNSQYSSSSSSILTNFQSRSSKINAIHKRFYNCARPSAWERYQQLLIRYPQVEQKVSKEIIASFLEVTPQYLSKMIKENR